MMVPPTRRQQDLLRFLAGYLEAWGFAPSFSEMNGALGLRSKSCVARMVDALDERGLINRLPDHHRALEPTKPIAIPRVPDGAPLFFVPIKEID